MNTANTPCCELTVLDLVPFGQHEGNRRFFALRCVWQTAHAVRIPVIGVGGICTAEDLLEFILVGASAVEIGTANFMRPDAAFHIAETLPGVMEQYGIRSLDEIRGQLKVS